MPDSLPMALLGRRLAVAIPDTVLEEKFSLRDKTGKLGAMARAFAIYGVDLVEVFRDEGGRGEAELVRKVLEFLETPQYLRRRLYPLDEALKYAGALPALRTPSHRPKVQLEELRVGEIREGAAIGGGMVDVGLDSPLRMEGGPASGRVTVRVTSTAPLTGRAVSREEVREYWGYKVEVTGIQQVFSGKGGWLRVSTSRLGEPLSSQIPALRSSLAACSGVKLVFGSPSKGLFDLVGPDLRVKSDFVVNLFPGQQVATVRTEEAVFASLNLIGVLLSEKA